MYDLTEFLCVYTLAYNTMNKVETKAKITKLYFWLYDQKVSQTKEWGLCTAQLHSGRVPALSHVKLYSSSHIKHTLNDTSVCKIHTWPLTKCPFTHVHSYSSSFLSEAAAAVGLWSSEARMVGAVAVLGTDRQHSFIHCKKRCYLNKTELNWI